MSERVKEKVKVLRELGVQVTQEMKDKLSACQNDVQLDNCARQFMLNHWGY